MSIRKKLSKMCSGLQKPYWRICSSQNGLFCSPGRFIQKKSNVSCMQFIANLLRADSKERFVIEPILSTVASIWRRSRAQPATPTAESVTYFMFYLCVRSSYCRYLSGTESDQYVPWEAKSSGTQNFFQTSLFRAILFLERCQWIVFCDTVFGKVF